MKVLIIENDEVTRTSLIVYMKSFTHNSVLAYQGSLNILNDIKNLKFDLAFIDVSSTTFYGMYIAHKLLEHNPNINLVFITSFNDYAAEIFEAQSMDYILKPIDLKRLKYTIDKIARRLDKPILKIMGDIKIKLFGHMEVKNGYRNIHFRRNKSKEILSYLIIHDYYATRDQLINDLYVDIDMRKAIIHLQTQIYQLRKDLQPLKEYIHITTTEDGYFLELNDVEIDYLQFMSSNYEECSLETCEEMIKLYGKGLLSNISKEWVIRHYIQSEDRVIQCYKKYLDLL